jgi:hypothetical protein
MWFLFRDILAELIVEGVHYAVRYRRVILAYDTICIVILALVIF